MELLFILVVSLILNWAFLAELHRSVEKNKLTVTLQMFALQCKEWWWNMKW